MFYFWLYLTYLIYGFRLTFRLCCCFSTLHPLQHKLALLAFHINIKHFPIPNDLRYCAFQILRCLTPLNLKIPFHFLMVGLLSSLFRLRNKLCATGRRIFSTGTNYTRPTLTFSSAAYSIRRYSIMTTLVNILRSIYILSVRSQQLRGNNFGDRWTTEKWRSIIRAGDNFTTIAHGRIVFLLAAVDGSDYKFVIHVKRKSGYPLICRLSKGRAWKM